MAVYAAVNNVVKPAPQVSAAVNGVVRTAGKGFCGVGGVVRQFYGALPAVSGVLLRPASAIQVYTWNGSGWTRQEDAAYSSLPSYAGLSRSGNQVTVYPKAGYELRVDYIPYATLLDGRTEALYPCLAGSAAACTLTGSVYVVQPDGSAGGMLSVGNGRATASQYGTAYSCSQDVLALKANPTVSCYPLSIDAASPEVRFTFSITIDGTSYPITVE